MSVVREAELDRRIKALSKLCRTKGGRQIVRDHGRAIARLMMEGLPE